MRKLISANFSRLWKEKIFWICIGVMLVYAVVYMLNGCRMASHLSEYHYSIDKFYFHFALVIGLFCALFCSMFLGTEYSDGTIRNKLIVGHTREGIYLANLLCTFAATLLIMAVWLVGALVAIPALGIWEMGVLNLLKYLLAAVMVVAAFSSIFTLISMLSSNKAVTVVLSMILFLALLIMASMIYNRLGEPEMVSDIMVTADGMQMGDPVPNPNYVSGTMRQIYQFMLCFLPTGQGILMWQLEIGNLAGMLLSSALLTVVPTFGGIAAFKRKNLK